MLLVAGFGAKREGARERYVFRVTCYNFHFASITLLCLWLGRVNNDDSGRKAGMMFCADEIIPMLNNIKVNFHLCIALPLKFKIA